MLYKLIINQIIIMFVRPMNETKDDELFELMNTIPEAGGNQSFPYEWFDYFQYFPLNGDSKLSIAILSQRIH